MKHETLVFDREATQCLISVVIPVKNGEEWIEAGLKGILQQTLAPVTEIIILDSGSTDKTLEIVSHYPVKLVHVPPGAFNHGLTRNLGVEHASGAYVVMTVQDARPMDKNWLENLLAGFADETVAGVCGGQAVPHEPDKNPVDWYFPVSEPKLKQYSFPPGHFEALSPAEKQTVCSWDNVNAMYRKDVLRSVPFRRMVFGEDAIWAMDALCKGYSIVYQPRAKVFHYHHENRSFVFKRHLTTMYFRYRYFKVMPKKPIFSFKKQFAIFRILFMRLRNVTIRDRINWWKYNKERFKGAMDAFNVFQEAVRIGEEELDRTHEKYCGMPPIAPARNEMHQVGK